MNTNSDLEMTLGTTAPRGPGKTFKRRSRVLIAEDDWAFRDMLLFAFEDEAKRSGKDRVVHATAGSAEQRLEQQRHVA
jgi:CheY-like chemotaxis protein